MVRLVFRPYTKFDDRFARQNRYEPPPEFPLASPYSGIVHHLSGPSRYALTQIYQRISRSVDNASLPRGEEDLTNITFIARKGFAPKHSHIC